MILPCLPSISVENRNLPSDIHLLGDENDDDESSTESKSTDSFLDMSEIESCEIMDLIEEAWEVVEANGSLVLKDVTLHPDALQQLWRKWKEATLPSATLSDVETSLGKTNKVPIHKLVLDRCSFYDPTSVQLMALFLHQLSSGLQEVSILTEFSCSDSARRIPSASVSSQDATRRMPYRRPSPLPCIVSVFLESMATAMPLPLKCLELEGADLRGHRHGYQLRSLLHMSSELEVLQLYQCKIDDEMLKDMEMACRPPATPEMKPSFLNKLCYLNMGGWNLTNIQFQGLVEALIPEDSKGTNDKRQDVALQFLDMSDNPLLGVPALVSLIRLLDHCPFMKEVSLCGCKGLLWLLEDGSSSSSTSLVSSWGTRPYIPELDRILQPMYEPQEPLQVDSYSRRLGRHGRPRLRLGSIASTRHTPLLDTFAQSSEWRLIEETDEKSSGRVHAVLLLVPCPPRLTLVPHDCHQHEEDDEWHPNPILVEEDWSFATAEAAASTSSPLLTLVLCTDLLSRAPPWSPWSRRGSSPGDQAT